jgi:cupin 2 domain-containing protein
MKNLFEPHPAPCDEEHVDVLAQGSAFRFERIVSMGHATPPGQWYDQSRDEWVVLLSGSARLRFEDDAEAVAMRPGDWVRIAAHRRHRVEETDATAPSVWLALHFDA